MIGSSLSFPPKPKRCRSLTTVDLNPRCISASPTTSTSRWISLRRIISKIRSRSIPQSPHLETRRSGHRRSNSPDASSSSLVDAIDAEKALSPYKLAQLWTVDPKRAKRYRDTTGLTTENTELKLRLQGMEQQANLCDALKNEVDRLKIATGEIVMHTDAYGLGLHPLTYSQAPFFSHQSQHGQRELQAMKMW